MRLSEARRNASAVVEILRTTYPDAACALRFTNPFELLVATILSAQCTDKAVNKVTGTLFRKYKTAKDFAKANPAAFTKEISSIPFFRNKAKNLLACAAALVERHGGKVPATMDELVALPGVGRKTANVVLGNAFETPGMVVDTHVKRVAGRLGWTEAADPAKIEADLQRLLPPEEWTEVSHLLIHHGRALCKAPTPLCSSCPLFDLCPRRGVTRSR